MGTLTAVGDRLVATGGNLVDDDHVSVEIYHPHTGWTPAPLSLNLDDANHCAVAVNNSHLFIVSGLRNEHAMEITLYNIDSGEETRINPPHSRPGAKGGKHLCVKHGDYVYLDDGANDESGALRLFEFSLEAYGEAFVWPWREHHLPAREASSRVKAMAVVNGEVLVVYDGSNCGSCIHVLRGGQWVEANYHLQWEIGDRDVAVIPGAVG